MEICYLLKNISSKICFNLLTRLLKIQTGTNYAGISMVIFLKKIFSKPKRPLVTLWTMDKGYWDSTVMRNPSRPLTFRISHPTTYPRGTTCFMAVISLTWSQEQINHRTGTGPVKVNQKIAFFGSEMTFFAGFQIQFGLAPVNWRPGFWNPYFLQ